MPSPFPGMNPYLEAQYWAGVHHWLITELARYRSASPAASELSNSTKKLDTVGVQADCVRPAWA
ncbi:MAG: DUF4058 family protein [Alkalinema sp. RU_4_3]|nr:DUF4058 family protein [Alkalinema sp. RU_4_3]